MTTEMSPIPVPARQFAIGRRGTQTAKLITENIWSCTGFIGIDRKHGWVFLCHLNTVLCPFALPALFDELKERVGGLGDFDLYTVEGMNPTRMWLFWINLAVLLIAVNHWELGLVCLVAPIWFSLTRWHLWIQLRLKKDFARKPLRLGHTTARAGFGMVGVLVDADVNGLLTVTSYSEQRHPDIFRAPCKFRMTRANGSYREDADEIDKATSQTVQK